MKKVGDLFAELGFRPEGSDSVKRAFVKNLVKAAAENAPRTQAPSRAPVVEHQLSFDFADEPETPFPLRTKRSAG